jgi:hypothetical protein
METFLLVLKQNLRILCLQRVLDFKSKNQDFGSKSASLILI